MNTILSPAVAQRFGLARHRNAATVAPPQTGLSWGALPQIAQIYVVLVIAAGTTVLVQWFPRTYARPSLFFLVLASVCVTAAWKVNLPIPLTSGSTLSVSYAAKLMALLLLGPEHAVLIAVAGAFVQCTYKVKQPYPLYRTVFSMTAEALTMVATSVAYVSLGGPTGPFDVSIFALAKPLIGAIAVYFLFNTGLVAGAIALSTHQRITKVWRSDFLWSGVTFMVAGTAGAMAAIVINRGNFWVALLLLAPIYLTYRTYQLFVARLDDQQRHMTEMRKMHEARHELLEREQTARASAEQANRLKDQFLAIVSHELRTPLNAILGWTDMLRQGMLDEGRRERAYQVVYDSAQRQAQLIDELLDIARIVSGKLRLDVTSVDLQEVVRAALNVVQPAADAKGVHLVFQADTVVCEIEGDKARLQQIAWNLASNAIKFTPKGGRVHVQLRRLDEFIELVVADTGQGIPHEFLASVFEPFRQADESTTRVNGGLGLGLSIVRHLVEAHGGTVTVQSSGQDQGATFTVRLPIPAANPQRLDASVAGLITAPPLPAHATSLKGISVLVVDDDEEGRLIVATQLEAHHAGVFTASSAAQALDVLQREHIDVLLADIAMPEEDGYTLIRRVRALRSSALASIPAAALTAFARNEDRLQALEAGFHSHLAKPIDANLLVTTVARLGGKPADRRQGRRPALH
jgi:signal transduction histidine kinase/ActR/RegA family two-component response regulator